tara:strand:+ start:449 stop:1120 length:672 start_codon:yes stop_codon:yes gene_type:complete
MIKRFINKKSLFYKPYLYFRIFWIEKVFIKRKTYSQCGEDLFIKNFFRNKRNGKFVDLGAYNPIKYNNTYLLYQKGWTGINIDLNETSIDQFNIIRKKDKNIIAAISDKKIKTKVYFENLFSPLNTLVKNFNSEISEKNFKYMKTKKFEDLIKRRIDFINIDIEGMDFKVLKSINLKFYKPKLICIEIFGKKNVKIVKNYLKNKKYFYIKKIGPSYFFSLNKA